MRVFLFVCFRFWNWVSLLFHFINHQWVISYIPMIQTTVDMSEWLVKSLIQLLYGVQHLGITIPSAKSPRYPYLNRSQTELKIPTTSLKISFVFQYSPLTCVYLLFWFTCWVQKVFIFTLSLFHTWHQNTEKMNESLNDGLETIQSWNLKLIMAIPLVHCFWHISFFEILVVCIS